MILGKKVSYIMQKLELIGLLELNSKWLDHKNIAQCGANPLMNILKESESCSQQKKSPGNKWAFKIH